MGRRTSNKASKGHGALSHHASGSSARVSSARKQSPDPMDARTSSDEAVLADMALLSLDDASPASGPTSGPASESQRRQRQPFRFMDLPGELRIKVYQHFFADVGRVIDLDPDNHKRIHKKLAILRTCRTMYAEASYLFYSTQTFRVFPCHWGRYFHTKKPLLARMKPRQRRIITSLELRLGPGWSNPPPGWVVNSRLGLADCTRVQTLHVFIECDPSDSIFSGWRQENGFYESFSQQLLASVLIEVPTIKRVQFDANESVKKSGGMMLALLGTTVDKGREVTWGPDRGWADSMDEATDPATGPPPHSTTPVPTTLPLDGAGRNAVAVA